MDLVKVLEATVTPDQNELQAALHHLEEAAKANLPELLVALSNVLMTRTNSSVVRIQAGLQLKNFLYSKDEAIRAEYQRRWLQLPENIRQVVKNNVFATLGTEETRPSSSAQCVAYIACAELPVSQSTEIIGLLCQNIANQASDENLKEATLEAIGYICQDIDPEILKLQASQILTAIVNGMRKDELSNRVKLAATRALLNSLEFTRANFEVDAERNFIMQVVCEATQWTDPQVKVAALQCLVKIMSLYYQYMEPYMGPALFAITMEAMKSEQDEIVLQGIEFWSNVCDEEMDLALEASEAEETGKLPDRTSRFYAKGALRYLAPTILETLTKQDEHNDEDEWNPHKAAGVCLMLLAQCCEDDVVEHVTPFVSNNVEHADWRCRDAAIMAFGSILEGPSPDTLKPYLHMALATIIRLLKDESVVVRDTAAWTVGRVCEMVPDMIIDPAQSETVLKPLITALLEGLDSEPRVASNVCWAFSSLAEAAYEAAENQTEDGEPTTYVLSQYFQVIIEKLLLATTRPDGSQANLRSGAYESLMGMVKNSPADCYEAVQNTTLIILQRLQQVFELESQIASNSDRQQFNDLQSLLCATLHSVLRKMTPDDAPKISDPIMQALLRMFSFNPQSAGGVHEDAMLAVSTLIEVLGKGFMKYMESFKPFLIAALKNHTEYQVCLAAVGVIGDLCRALGRDILPLCDEIMTLLCENLVDPSVHRSVKPQILSVFGDTALAIGNDFRKYLDVVLTTLQQASMAQVDTSDYDMVDYLNELRESCLEAYTGILQGLKPAESENMPPQGQLDMTLVAAHLPHMLRLVEQISGDENRSDAVLGAAAGLVGDMLETFPAEMTAAGVADKQTIQTLLTAARRCSSAKAKQLGLWASKGVRKLKKQQQTCATDSGAGEQAKLAPTVLTG